MPLEQHPYLPGWFFVTTMLLLLMYLVACSRPASVTETLTAERAKEVREKSDVTLLSPRSEEAIVASYIDLAIYHVGQGEHEKALESLAKVQKIAPNNILLHGIRALAWQGLGADEKAQMNFKRALSLSRKSRRNVPDPAIESQMKNNYAQFLCSRQQYAEAEALFSEVVQDIRYENKAIAYANWGFCVYQQQNMAQAKKYLLQALEYEQALPSVYLRLCRIELGMKEYINARNYLHRYREYALHTPESLWLGIQIEHVLGDSDALASYDLLLKEKFPQSPEVNYAYCLQQNLRDCTIELDH